MKHTFCFLPPSAMRHNPPVMSWLLALLLLILCPGLASGLDFVARPAPDATLVTIALAPDEHLDAEFITSPLPFEVAPDAPDVLRFPPLLTTVPLTYQLCVGTLCYPPVTTNIQVLNAALPEAAVSPLATTPGSPAPPAGSSNLLLGYVRPAELIDFLENNRNLTGDAGESAAVPASSASAVTSFDEASAEDGEAAPRKSLWLALPGLFLAGVLLNLTPCTLPLIPVTLIILGVGRSTTAPRRQRILVGCVYAFGILLAYAALALLSDATGNLLGAYAASPWFNLVAALLLILLAFRPPDLARFRPRASMPANRTAAPRPFRTAAIAFVYGLLTAALASACTAPALLAALTWSARLSAEGAHLAALLLPCAIGVGLAAPWPFLAAGLSILPPPGPWMTRLAKLFTVLVLVLAAYYLYLAVRLWQPAADPVEKTAHTYDLSLSDDIDRLESNLSDRDGSALLLFTATWCKNCHALHRNTLADPAVQDYLTQHNITLYVLQADHPTSPPAADYLAAHSIPAFPSLLLLP